VSKLLDGIDCYVLAGGYGTRLAETLPDVPKFLAPVRGVPVGELIVERLALAEARRIVLGLGYRAEAIVTWLRDYQRRGGTGRTICVFEHQPRGTAAALRLAAPFLESDPVLVCNGDTLWDGDLTSHLLYHQVCDSGVTAIVHDGVETGIRLYSQEALKRGEATFIPSYTKVPFVDVGTPDGYARANGA
jgi:D-glycero-alpha-D-manno-heptose 1-phosphate guanylyltransferase